MTEPREQERASKQEQPGPAQADPKEDGPMDDARFQAWASEIGLTDAQWLPVRVVLDREFERGLAAADRAREPDLPVGMDVSDMQHQATRAAWHLQEGFRLIDTDDRAAMAHFDQARQRLAFLASGDEQ